MRYVVKFEDNEEYSGKRQEFMQEHLKFLESKSLAIQHAGPMFDANTGANAGGMWIVEAPNRDDVQGLIEADPFYPTGLRKHISINEWKLVFENGATVK